MQNADLEKLNKYAKYGKFFTKAVNVDDVTGKLREIFVLHLCSNMFKKPSTT